jgi:hypothetical protein
LRKIARLREMLETEQALFEENRKAEGDVGD